MRSFPDQGSNPAPLALGAQSLSHWTTREALQQLAKVKITSTVFSVRHSLTKQARCCSAPLAPDLSWRLEKAVIEGSALNKSAHLLASYPVQGVLSALHVFIH